MRNEHLILKAENWSLDTTAVVVVVFTVKQAFHYEG